MVVSWLLVPGKLHTYRFSISHKPKQLQPSGSWCIIDVFNYNLLCTSGNIFVAETVSWSVINILKTVQCLFSVNQNLPKQIFCSLSSYSFIVHLTSHPLTQYILKKSIGLQIALGAQTLTYSTAGVAVILVLKAMLLFLKNVCVLSCACRSLIAVLMVYIYKRSEIYRRHKSFI